MKNRLECEGNERNSKEIARVKCRSKMVIVILCLLSFIAGGLVFGHKNSGAYLFAILGILMFLGVCVGSLYLMAKFATDFRNRNRRFHLNPGSRFLKEGGTARDA